MDNPGIKNLAAVDFSGVSGAPLAAATDLDGALSVTLEMIFKWGSSATPTGYVKVQTTLDGVNWSDVARFDFAQTSVRKHANIEFLLSKGVTQYADLNSEGVYDGVMGNQLRAVPFWTGSYAGSSLAVNAHVR